MVSRQQRQHRIQEEARNQVRAARTAQAQVPTNQEIMKYAPPAFRRDSQDREDWMAGFNRYTVHKGWQDPQTLTDFSIMLQGDAAIVGLIC